MKTYDNIYSVLKDKDLIVALKNEPKLMTPIDHKYHIEHALENHRIDAVDFILRQCFSKDPFHSAPQLIAYLKLIVALEKQNDIDEYLINDPCGKYIPTGIREAIIGKVERVNRYVVSRTVAQHRCSLIHGTPLHHVTNPDCVEIFFRKDAKLNAKDRYGRTPLHIALEKGHFKVAERLLDFGAGIMARTAENEIPLHYAVVQKDIPPKLLDRLSKYNADVGDRYNRPYAIKNTSGANPLDLAVEYNSNFICRLIEQDLLHEGFREHYKTFI